jgi:hypothetical protein
MPINKHRATPTTRIDWLLHKSAAHDGFSLCSSAANGISSAPVETSD